MTNTVTLTFAGDADTLVREAKRARTATTDAGDAATTAGRDYERASGQSKDLATRLGSLGAAADGASGAIGDTAGTMQALVDVSSYAERAAADHARAVNDLAQAQADATQATLDATQANLDATQADQDAEQAKLDQVVAQEEYNKAVAEHGKNSAEARQSALDLSQAQIDYDQALADAQQAMEDSRQATVDLEAAQLDANDAMKEANPPQLQKWADQLNTIAPLLQGVVGIVALVTAAQWAWNVALAANPVGLVIVGVAALIAVIALIATKTTFFQDLWRVSWSAIKDAASATVDFIGKIPGWTESAFRNIANVISWPYRTAFNLISDAWNNTIGQLSWSVPSWIPALGGNTISVPQLPRFHTGGRVPGMPGQEVAAILQAGETVLPTQSGGAAFVIELHSGGTAFDDALVEILAGAMRARGGDPAALNIDVRRP